MVTQTIKPRQAGPKAIRRWALQAFDLIGRSFHTWTAMMLVLCLLIFATQLSPFLSQILALSAYFTGIGVAAMLDDRTHPGFIAILQRIWKEVPTALFTAGVILGLCTALDLLIDVVMRHPISLKVFYDTTAIAQPSVENIYSATNQLFDASLKSVSMAFFMVFTGLFSSTFHYHCMTILGASWSVGVDSGDPNRGGINKITMLYFSAILVFVPFMLKAIAPFLAPVYFCFAAAFSYVAFREIYLGISENRKIVAAEARSLAGILDGAAVGSECSSPCE